MALVSHSRSSELLPTLYECTHARTRACPTTRSQPRLGGPVLDRRPWHTTLLPMLHACKHACMPSSLVPSPLKMWRPGWLISLHTDVCVPITRHLCHKSHIRHTRLVRTRRKCKKLGTPHIQAWFLIDIVFWHCSHLGDVLSPFR